MNTILQVPIDRNLRDQAAITAQNMGFSSLQEAVRIFLNKMARQQIEIQLTESVQLSPKAIKRYNKIIDDIDKGKNVYEAKDLNDLMRKLNAP